MKSWNDWKLDENIYSLVRMVLCLVARVKITERKGYTNCGVHSLRMVILSVIGTLRDTSLANCSTTLRNTLPLEDTKRAR